MNNETQTTTLDELGYGEFFNAQWKSLQTDDTAIARVITEHKEVYKVKNPQGEYEARITGKHMFNAKKRADYPAVGDWVIITELGDDKATIHSILQRKTVLKKKYNEKNDAQIIGTNIDVAFIIESLDRDYSLNRFERYVVLAREGGIIPALILNKIDLVTEIELNQRITEIRDRFEDIDIIATSTHTDHGLTQLSEFILPGKTYCFLGSSGVGKSSLINKLLKKDAIKTGEISDSAHRGKHTTTAREMYFLENGGIVIDNPGTRGVGMTDAHTGIEEVFDEIASLSHTCKFSDCTHTHEPGCAVLDATQEGGLDENKYQNFITLKKENEFHEMTEIEKRRKEKKFGKFIKKTLEQLKDTEPQ